MDIYLFLWLFRRLFLCLSLARSRCIVLLAEDVVVLVVIRKQVDGFLGFDFLLLGCKNKGVKAVRSTSVSAMIPEMVPNLPGLF